MVWLSPSLHLPHGWWRRGTSGLFAHPTSRLMWRSWRTPQVSNLPTWIWWASSTSATKGFDGSSIATLRLLPGAWETAPPPHGCLRGSGRHDDSQRRRAAQWWRKTCREIFVKEWAVRSWCVELEAAKRQFYCDRIDSHLLEPAAFLSV